MGGRENVEEVAVENGVGHHQQQQQLDELQQQENHVNEIKEIKDVTPERPSSRFLEPFRHQVTYFLPPMPRYASSSRGVV